MLKKDILVEFIHGGQRPTEYEHIGYEMTKGFSDVLQNMSADQVKNLVTVMNYFEMHAQPARSILDAKVDGYSYKFYSEIAWSHFMTMIMFGMLEVVVAKKPCAKLNKKGDLIDLWRDIRCSFAHNAGL